MLETTRPLPNSSTASASLSRIEARSRPGQTFSNMSPRGVSTFSLTSSAPASLRISRCLLDPTYGSTPMGMPGYSARTRETASAMRATVSSTLPATPLVKHTAPTSWVATDSASIAMTASAVRLLDPPSFRRGDEQNAQRNTQHGSRLKNACPGQCLTTGTISTSSRNGSPPRVMDSPDSETRSSNSPESYDTDFLTVNPPKENATEPNPAPGPAVERDILQGTSNPSGRRTPPPRASSAFLSRRLSSLAIGGPF